jgi:hypothetical protein
LDASSAQKDADGYTAALDQSPVPQQDKDSQCMDPATAPPACGSLRDSLDHRDRSREIALGAFIAGGVLAAGSAVAYFLWPSGGKKEQSAIRVVPWVAKTSHGASLRMDF